MGSQLFVSKTVAALTLLSSCQTSPKPKRGNAKCASGAKSPEAPNDPCSNMTGRISSLKKSINLNKINDEIFENYQKENLYNNL